MVKVGFFFFLYFQTLMNVRSCQVSAKVEIASTLLAASSVNVQKVITSVKRQESVKVSPLKPLSLSQCTFYENNKFLALNP